MSNRSRYSIVLSRTLAFALVSVIVAGCAERDMGAIRFGLATAPVTLDPRFATDATSYRIGRLIYQSLVDFDDAQRAIPALASWTEVSPTRYRFQLNASPRFHDGSALTSADVAATYRSVLDPATGSPHRGSLMNIQLIEAPADDTIEFVLNKPDPLFPGLLVIGIMPAATITGVHGEHAMVPGSGPFAIDAPPTETVLRLRRVADGQRVEFVTIADATVRALKILHGEIDLMQGSMTPELVSWLDQRDGIRALHRAGTTFTYLGFNLNDPALRDIRLRRAIAHAIDRKTLTTYLFGGSAQLAQAIFSPAHWAGNNLLAPVPYDPARARRLLSELGYDAAKPLSLEYKTSSDHFRLRVATAIQDQLTEVGIHLTISSFDWGTFYADVKSGRFQMFSLSWVGLKQPDIFRYAFHSDSVPPVGANRGRYASPEVDELIAAAEASADLGYRASLYARIQERLLEDLPYVPLWYEDNIVIYRDSIADYDTGLDGYYDALATTRRVTKRD